jgi:hypothetical protein
LPRKLFCKSSEKVTTNEILVCHEILPRLCRDLYRELAMTFATAFAMSFVGIFAA